MIINTNKENVLTIPEGGTGAGTALAALTNFGIGKLLDELSGDAVNSPSGYEFPNGLKVAWGHFSDKETGALISLPFTFTSGKVIINPRYSTGASMRCLMYGIIKDDGNSWGLTAWDTNTQTLSTNTLSGHWICIGF